METSSGSRVLRHMTMVLLGVVGLMMLWLWIDNVRQAEQIRDQQERLVEVEDVLTSVSNDAERQAAMVMGTNYCQERPQAVLCMESKRVLDRVSVHGPLQGVVCADDGDIILTYTDGTTARTAGACLDGGEQE